jgi:hypothetical protein
MKPRLFPFATLCLLLAVAALTSGCVSLSDVAMDPYDKALRNGRMTPAEHMRQRDELERAASGQR